MAWGEWKEEWTAQDSAPDVSGTYRDSWTDAVFNLKQSGESLTVVTAEWGDSPGTVKGSEVEVWGLVGTFDGSAITWSNGSTWARDSAASKEEALSTAEPESSGAAAEIDDPWSEAVTIIDVSGTYTDPWQNDERYVFKQNGTRLTAEGADGSWGPEEGTVKGVDIEIWGKNAKFEGGKIHWSEGNVWPPEPAQAQSWSEPVAAGVASLAALRDDRHGRDQLLRLRPSALDQASAATPSLPATVDRGAVGDAQDVSGTWEDPWRKHEQTVLAQRGRDVTATAPDGSWGPERGTIDGYNIELFGMKAEFWGDSIKWEHGGEWKRTAAGAAPAASAPEPAASASAAEAPAASDPAWAFWGSTGAATSSDPWAPGADGAAAAAGWGTESATAAAADEQDARRKKEVRWKEFQMWQDWYTSQGVLPGKTSEEIAADEVRLFAQTSDDRAGIDFDLYDKVLCDISGPKSENIPQLVTFEALFDEFADFLPAELVENIRRCGYKRPTPVQKFSIPAALTGRDIMCCAQTGSGKTAAFLVPVLASMIKHSKACGALDVPFEGPCKPDTVVICPTRELCLQIYDEAMKFCHKTPHRCVRVYGQEGVKVQISDLAKGGDLCISTPGRLWDFVNSGIVEVTDVSCLVLDEADRMLTMNMEGFIREVVEKYNMPPKEQRQTLMFSATFPETCQKLAQDYLYEHVWIGVGVIGGAVCTVTQTLVRVAPEDKKERLVKYLNEWLDNREAHERLLVFCNKKVEAKGLDELLYERNIDTGALHADLTQTERETNLNRFRNGEIDVLVATDLASRGLDIVNVSHVVNYDLPWKVDMYVQRIGRTGRIGHRGQAMTFIAVDKATGEIRDEEEVLKVLPSILKDDDSGCDNEVPTWLLEYAEKARAKTWEEENGDNQRWWNEQTDVRSSYKDKGTWNNEGSWS